MRPPGVDVVKDKLVGMCHFILKDISASGMLLYALPPANRDVSRRALYVLFILPFLYKVQLRPRCCRVVLLKLKLPQS